VVYFTFGHTGGAHQAKLIKLWRSSCLVA